MKGADHYELNSMSIVPFIAFNFTDFDFTKILSQYTSCLTKLSQPKKDALHFITLITLV